MDNYNYEYLIFDLALTITVYMFFPLIYKLFHKSEIEEKKAKKIAVINSVIVMILFFLMKAMLSDGNAELGIIPAFLYYSINKSILTWKNSNKAVNYILIALLIVCCVSGWFVGAILFYPIALVILIALIVNASKSEKSSKAKINTRKKNKKSKEIYCSECGATIQENDNYCLECGAYFTDDVVCVEQQEDCINIEENIATNNLYVQKKTRYCKICGGKLNENKKCTKCGKQYFHIKSKNILILIPVSVMLILSIIINVKFYNKNEILSDDNWELYMENKRLEEENEEIHSNLFSIIGTNGVYYTQEKLDFFDENIVFVIEGYGNKYYTYDCMLEITDGPYTYWAYNIEAAKYKGYKKGTC